MQTNYVDVNYVEVDVNYAENHFFITFYQT